MGDLAPLEDERTINPAAESRQPDGSRWPDTPLGEREPLPEVDGSAVTRGSDGLIEKVDGRPVRDYVEGVAADRAARYVELMRDPDARDFSIATVGPVVAVAFDRETGRIYEGTNRTFGGIPTDLHPVLQKNLDEVLDEGRANPNGYDYRRDESDPPDSGPWPHPDLPENTQRCLR